jgi:hypothetical protein
VNCLPKSYLLSNHHGRATIHKDEGGGMNDEVKAVEASLSSFILPPSSFPNGRASI